MFNERLSVLFKKRRIVRMVDARRNALVYLTYSDRLIDGSLQNSLTAGGGRSRPADSAAVMHRCCAGVRGWPRRTCPGG